MEAYGLSQSSRAHMRRTSHHRQHDGVVHKDPIAVEARTHLRCVVKPPAGCDALPCCHLLLFRVPSFNKPC